MGFTLNAIKQLSCGYSIVEYFKHNNNYCIMKRKKGIILSALVESLFLALLLVLFFTGIISLNLFIALAVVVGLLFSTAVLLIVRKCEP